MTTARDDDDDFTARTPSVPERIATGLHKVALALRHRAQGQANERGVSPTQGQILAMLLAHEREAVRGAGLKPSELAARLAVKMPTVSDAVKALEGKELVARKPVPDDARVSLVTLTARGRREAESGAQWPDFLTSAIGAMRSDEQVVFLGGVVKMVAALQDGGHIPVARMCLSCDFFRARVHRDAARPHHCAYADAPLGPADLRLDCPEHEPADPVRRAQNAALFES